MHVPGEGPAGAKIAFVGEAPGVEEAMQGRPFVGSSGKLLNQMLTVAGIDRKDCYLTNVIKIRPPNNDFGIFYTDKARKSPSQMLLTAWDKLRLELTQVSPNVVVPLGGEALQACTGKRGIDSWRGSILGTAWGAKCIPTLHPAYVLRQYSARPIVELDLRRVLAESKTREISIPQVRFEVRPSLQRVLEYLRLRPKRLAFDIETTGRHVRSLGLSSEQNHAICIPFIQTPATGPSPGDTVLFLDGGGSAQPTSYWSEPEELAILTELYKLFADPTVQKIAHNYPFDAVILAREFGLEFKAVYMDTMVAHHACYCELPKGLDFLCSIYTRHPYYSDYDPSNDHQTWVYNCYDAAVTLECSYRLDREMVELGIDEFYFNHKHPATLAYVTAETRGIAVDDGIRSSMRERIKAEVGTEKNHGLVGTLTQRIRDFVGDQNFNPGSPKQIQDYLYGKLKIPPVLHHKTKQPTTDKHAIEKLQAKYPELRPFLATLSEHSKKDTLLSSFLNPPLGTDGRMRTHYNSAGTVTDRVSSSEPLFDIGVNLTNIPRGDFRRMFVADEGWTLIKADLSSAEFRIVCWLACIERLIKQYKENPNFDVHTWFASLAFGIPEELVERKRSDGQLSQRDIAKNGVYGGNYSMRPPTAARTYKMPIEKATFILNKYREVIPEIPAWWERVKQTVNSTRTIRGPFGNLRFFFDRLEDDLYRAAYSHSAQNVVGEIIHRAFALLTEIFVREDQPYPLLQVHDEIVCQAPVERANEVARIVRTVMEYPIYFPGVDIPLIIPADVSVGPNWFDQKKVDFATM